MQQSFARRLYGAVKPWAVVFLITLMVLSAGSAHAATLSSHAALTPLHLTGLALMGITADAVNYRKVSDLNLGYRRSTTKLYRTYTKRVPEYRWFDNIPDEEIIPSGRENNILLDVAVGVGAHQMDDAGWESRTETPQLQEGSFIFNHTNARFAISLRAQAFDKAARGNQIVRQIKYQSVKCIEGVMRKYGFMTYGYSTGVVAVVNGGPSAGLTPTLTLKNAYGNVGMSNAAYLASMFPVDEGVGFIRANALVVMGTVTAADPVAGTITLSLNDNIAINDGDQIVFANGVIGATLSETDYNKWNVGLFDGLVTDTVHGVSKAAVPTWAPALYDAAGGSWGFLKARKMKQALENKGDTVLRRIILSNGVLNDKDARERSSLIWTNNSTGMNIDGNARLKGVTEDTSRFTPPTCAFGLGADAMGKKVLTEKPDEEETIDFGKLYKAEDRSALKGGVDLISAMVIRSRSRLAGYTGLNEQ